MQTQQSGSHESNSPTKAPRALFTVAQFVHRNTAFSQAAIRNLIFKAEERDGANGTIPGNGLLEAGAILRVGRKVLVDEERFFEWVDLKNLRGG